MYLFNLSKYQVKLSATETEAAKININSIIKSDFGLQLGVFNFSSQLFLIKSLRQKRTENVKDREGLGVFLSLS